MSLQTQVSTGLLQIAEAAAGFGERRSRASAQAQSRLDPPVRVLLQSWQESVAPAGPDAFAKRLAWDGMDEEAACHLLAARDPLTLEMLPSWVTTFRQAFGASPEETAARFAAVHDPADPVFDMDERIAFEELFHPAICFARTEVRQRAGAAYGLLEPAAHRAFERSLLRRLSHICERALYAKFTMRRLTSQEHVLASLFARGHTAGRAGVYAGFVREMQAGALFEFYREYSVAARLCAVVLDLWISATAEFLERLASDLAELETVFGAGRSLGSVVEVRAELGDAHAGGRAVVSLRFASGTRLIYKPRSLALERFYADMISWLNGMEGADLQLKSARVVDMRTHGWIEFIEQAPCTSDEEVRAFYTRTGMILALIYTLNGWDFHFENLIAAGEHPVLIDLETLFMPRFVLDSEGDGVVSSAVYLQELNQKFVTRTGLLPVLSLSNDERRAVDLSGLASSQRDEVQMEILCWRNANTDFMKLESHQIAPGVAVSVPRCAGQNRYVEGYLDEVISGFEPTYRRILSRRAEILAPGGPLDRMRPESVRFLFRGTNLYANTLERGLHPKYLRDGRDRLIELDVLARPFLVPEKRPRGWPVLASERESLEQLDIPFFTARVDGTALEMPGGDTIENFFEQSPHDEVRAKLHDLSDDDLEFQSELIRMAFRANSTTGMRLPYPASERQPVVCDWTARQLHEHALAEATRIAESLERRALRTPNGGLSWIGAGYMPRSRRYVVAPLSHALFDGYGGAALFLAAYGRLTHSEHHQRLALASVGLLQEEIGLFERKVIARSIVELGVATGLGSAVHALTHIGRLLDEPSLIRDAGRLAAAINPELLAKDDVLNLLFGGAGAIVSLLALADATGEDRWVAQAASCANHLLSRRTVELPNGRPRWTLEGDTHEPGLAMGTTGIALVLLRLYGRTGEPSFLEAAEHALLQEEEGLRNPSRADDLTTWSHGIPGLGLVQLEAPPGSSIRHGLPDSLCFTRNNLVDGRDDLTAGTMGRIDVLLTAGRALRDPDLVAEARAATEGVLRRARERGEFLVGWAPEIRHFGFLAGLGGIGYQLLRVTHPDELPSILDWR